MWWKEYQDYRHDGREKQQLVEPGKGIIGCEMHEVHGWQNTKTRPEKSRDKGIIKTLVTMISGTKEEEGQA